MNVKKELLKDTNVLFIIANIEKETELKYKDFNVKSNKRHLVVAR